jgi:predicted RNA binding protein with dsRBD fold (UPF0201 family)
LRPDLEGRVTLEANVSPSEDQEKVAGAVRNIVPAAAGQVETGSRFVRFASNDVMSLSHLRDQLRDRHVRAAARRLMLVGKEGNSTSLMLNRQAAAAGVVVVCGSPGESPLGPIYLSLESKKLDQLIDWLAAYETG